MSNPMLFLVPIGGALAGQFLWSRIVRLSVGVSGFGSTTRAAPGEDLKAVERKGWQFQGVMTAVWLLVIGPALGYMLHVGKTGWAMFFGGMFVAPVLNISTYLIFVRRLRKLRAPAATTPSSPT